MAVKIDAGEPIHFHIPTLIADREYRKEIAAKLGSSDPLHQFGALTLEEG